MTWLTWNRVKLAFHEWCKERQALISELEDSLEEPEDWHDPNAHYAFRSEVTNFHVNMHVGQKKDCGQVSEELSTDFHFCALWRGHFLSGDNLVRCDQ